MLLRGAAAVVTMEKGSITNVYIFNAYSQAKSFYKEYLKDYFQRVYHREIEQEEWISWEYGYHDEGNVHEMYVFPCDEPPANLA